MACATLGFLPGTALAAEPDSGDQSQPSTVTEPTGTKPTGTEPSAEPNAGHDDGGAPGDAAPQQRETDGSDGTAATGPSARDAAADVAAPDNVAALLDATSITSATIEFGFNNVQQGAAPAGGCNYFVAGKTQGLSSDYRSIDGDVYVVKKGTDGSTELVSVSTRCSTAAGSDKINQRFLFTNGTGETAADGSTSIQWTGAGTVNAYGGLVSWYFEDPKLELDAAGDGTITARLGGFGSSMADPEVKVPLEPRDGIEIATIRGAAIVDGAISINPLYAGVDYFPLTDVLNLDSPRTTVSAISDAAKANNPNWGAWPESFLDFQYATGLSSYWHSSGLSADPLKPPLPIEVALNGQAPDYSLLFVQEPVNAVLSAGVNVTFTAKAISKDGTPSLQWQVKRAGGEWTDLVGETREDLVLTAITVADWNGASVRAVASLAGASITTNAALLTVTQEVAPSFTTQPNSVSAGVESSAYFEVKAVGYPTPTVQWQRKAADGTWSNIAGASYPWFSYYPVAEADQGAVFRALATNSVGSTPSQEVTLTVTKAAATITYQPKSTAAFIGGNAYISVEVEGAPQPKIVWERSADGENWEVMPGRTRSLLAFSPVTAEDGNYSYRARASNGLGDEQISTSARVTVLEPSNPPVHVFPSTDIDPSIDNTIEFTFGKLPEIPAGRQGIIRWGIIDKTVWQPGDAPVEIGSFLAGSPAGLGDWSWFTTATWVPANSFDQSKEYGFAFFFAPSDGKATLPQLDMFVPISLGEAPAITTQPSGASVAAGTTAVFSVTASGSPAPGYQWQTKSGDDWVAVDGAQTADLSVSTTLADSGSQFRVVVSNGIGADAISDPATLTVTPSVTTQPSTPGTPGAPGAVPGSAAGGSSAAALASTGFDSLVPGALSVLGLMAGGFALMMTRRARVARATESLDPSSDPGNR